MIKEIKVRYYIFCAVFAFATFLAVLGNLLPLLAMVAGYIFADVTKRKEATIEQFNAIQATNKKYDDVKTDAEHLNSLHNGVDD